MSPRYDFPVSPPMLLRSLSVGLDNVTLTVGPSFPYDLYFLRNPSQIRWNAESLRNISAICSALIR
ncbi:hypothetical protein ACIQXZ_23385 [Bacillus thuringiensis]|uniref:hypothetical protein n=1 Tax=Bacillus thuringiensis TaxID=1428 RepID=UPI00380F6B8A